MAETTITTPKRTILIDSSCPRCGGSHLLDGPLDVGDYSLQFSFAICPRVLEPVYLSPDPETGRLTWYTNTKIKARRQGMEQYDHEQDMATLRVFATARE